VNGGRPLVVAITGASGAVYGVRIVERLALADVPVHLVISPWGRRTLEHETGRRAKDVAALASTVHLIGNQSAPISSGSFRTAGMIIAPCSVKTLAAIANGFADNLITRAADVTLKERRRLVVLLRESPLNEAHIENMLKVTRMGAVVVPPVPAFYSLPKSLDDIVDHTVMRVLDLFDIDAGGTAGEEQRRWDGAMSLPVTSSEPGL
jgi:polyprenyl P-hydroxybenzoate/phenylacrylic acid decarboxylase-like protein